MKKLTKLIACLCVAVIACGSLFACGTAKDGEQYLEVYCLFKGYGTDFAEKSLQAFAEQDWVKEKYPNLEIDFSYDDSNATAFNKLNNGKNYNTTDLIIGEALEEFYGNKGILANLTDSVYNSTVPNENITVGDKMIAGIRENKKYGKESLERNVYYGFPWVGGYHGILYNATILNSLGLEVPVTTDEFIKEIEVISNTNNSDYNVGYAIAENTRDGYWAKIFSQLWAQYSGIDSYSDFYYGLVDGQQTTDVFKSQGRLEALQVFERIFSPDKISTDYKYDSRKSTYRYIYPYANDASTDYITVQTGFLAGYGVFHANGDWFETEMYSYRKNNKDKGSDYEFKFMRTPIISSIINVLPDKSVADDAELALVVKAIDSGNTSLKGEGYEVTQADYDRIKEARSIVTAVSGTAVIPDYASAKDIAIDFLRFMATDMCRDIYLQNCYGMTPAFNYTSSMDEGKISDTHKSRLEIMTSKNLPIVVMPSKTQFPYGIEEFYKYDMYTTTLEALFSSGKKTAQTIFEDEINYWKTAQTQWQQMISSGGN